MTAPVGYGTTAPLPSPGFAGDRALYAMRELIRACLPQLALLGLWDYRIDAFDVTRPTEADCSPVDPSLGLPGAIRVTLTPSILGERVTPTIGSRVVVAFLDGNAAKPVAIMGDPSATPLAATLLGGTAYAARVGDTVTLSIAQLTASNANVGGTPVVWPVPIQATITAGSTKVKVG